MERIIKDKVVLIGMPGSGKTTVGRLLAGKLKYSFFDMDECIEKLSGKTVAELFKIGESVFREWETKVCMELVKKRRAVISAGGGAVERRENVSILKSGCVVIYLSRPVGRIAADINIKSRPLLKDGAGRLYELYKRRGPIYEGAADLTVENGASAAEAAAEALLKLHGRIEE